MIPQHLVDFLHGPVSLFMGTRDARLRPASSWVFGAIADADKDLISFFLPDPEAERPLQDLRDNGTVALSATRPRVNESYQFKGRCVDIRPGNEKDRAVQEIYEAKTSAWFEQAGYPPALFDGFTKTPFTVVQFQVEEIFVQTPGPGAGEKIPLAPGPG